jgi:hypothetical protein
MGCEFFIFHVLVQNDLVTSKRELFLEEIFWYNFYGGIFVFRVQDGTF